MGGGDGGPLVHALATSGSDIYAGGNFTTAGGTAATNIAKWNGSTWRALGPGIHGEVLAVAVSGSNVYVGGNFTIDGGMANNIARWDGSNWSALGAGTAGTYPHVRALVSSGSDLYAGGSFSMAGGSPANYIAKWDGNAWSALGAGLGSDVFSIAVSGNDLYAGGYFTTAGGKVSAYLARAYLKPLPGLLFFRSGPDLTLSWPSANTADFTLEQSTTLSPPTTWLPNTSPISDDGTNKSITAPATNPAQFFRLRRP
jgi:hypothetical protein